MAKILDNLKYSKDHEWLKTEGKIGTVGITDYAQDHLGDVVYVELPKVGAEFKAGKEFGVVESVKSVSSLFCPVSGKVVAINEALNDKPALVNESPYEEAWMIKIEMSDPAEANSLLSAEEYKKILEKE